MAKLTDEQRHAILAALQTGESQNSVAKRLAVGVATVNRMAQANGLEYSAPKKANAARRDYAQAERLALLNRAFDKASELMLGIEKPAQLMNWAIAFGILTDKRRLEDGQSTGRQEVVNVDSARDKLAGRIDELASRRRTKEAAG
jgi:hypothetical protein